MSAEDLTLNAAYAVYVASSLFRSERWIRIALIATSLVFITYGLIAPNTTVIIWNLLFGASHLYAVIRDIMAERRVALTEEQDLVRRSLFPTLTVVDFLYLWSLGRELELDHDEVLIERGDEHSLLLLVLDGDIHIDRVDGSRVYADTHSFIGEMRLLSGAAANATVVGHRSARLHSWSHSELSALEVLRPLLYAAMITVLGRDLTNKLNTANPTAE